MRHIIFHYILYISVKQNFQRQNLFFYRPNLNVIVGRRGAAAGLNGAFAKELALSPPPPELHPVR